MAAAFSHHGPGSRALSGSRNDDEQLPGGSCNFRDLSNGAKAPTCGCTRFWLNTHFNGHDPNTERAWCFCGHHACFHEAFSKQPSRVEAPPSFNKIKAIPTEEERNRYSGYEPARQQPATPMRASASQAKPAGLGIQAGSQQRTQSINTRVWEALNGFARDQEDGPPSITTSKLPSTATPSVVGDYQPHQEVPTQALQERPSQYRPMGPPVVVPQACHGSADEYSATEVATPSIAGTPDFRAFAAPGTQTRSSPSNIRPTQLFANIRNDHVRQSTEIPQPSSSKAVESQRPRTAPDDQLSVQELRNLLNQYGRRIDVLETLSFSHIPIEEIQEKFELFDGRLLDVEQWRGYQEQERQDRIDAEVDVEETAASKHRRLLPIETSSFDSDGSFDSNAALHAEAAVLATLAANAETGPRIDALENRIADLEYASLPSHNRPWHVQVILLPWGSSLRGVWFSSTEATQHSMKASTQASDEWSGAQSAPKTSFKSTSSAAWTTESIQAWADEAQDWLSPKACGPSGAVFQRLASRGFVQEVTLTSSDSRHVLNVVNSAFGHVLRSEDKPNPSEANQYRGLHESFIPLRKVRKSSRLRFLSPAEMTTSATWNARWFDSSVFMKVNDGQRRLYITTPEAYLQSTENTWTWHKLRRLPMHDASEDETSVELNRVAIEACWSYSDRLDQPPSTHTSFGSHESQWSLQSHDSDSSSVFAGDSVHFTADRPQTSSGSEARPVHNRTVSMPSVSSVPTQVIASLPKRRVASFETPAPTGHVEILASKRRRMDVSPEAERRGAGFTPRWSREPPSPFTSENTGDAPDQRSQGTSSRKRGATPFAYATPHSNGTFNGRVAYIGGDGDTEADAEEIGGARDPVDEDEWNGADDEIDAVMRSSDVESADDEPEVVDGHIVL